MAVSELISLMIKGVGETIYMTFLSSLLAYIIGLPVGVILVITDVNSIKPMVGFNKVLGFIVNVLRSIPFIILLMLMIPFTRFVLGTTLGSTAVVIPLTASAAPYVARMVESSLKEVDVGVIEAAKSMGASAFQIVTKVMLPEAKPSLLMGTAITVTTILGYSTMAGFTGGGGLGDIAVRYGVHRYNLQIMTVAVILIVIIVQGVQNLGAGISKKTDKRI